MHPSHVLHHSLVLLLALNKILVCLLVQSRSGNQILVAVLSRSLEGLYIGIEPSQRLGRILVLGKRALCELIL